MLGSDAAAASLGREECLRRVRDGLRDGRGVVVVGEAGVGKTMLLEQGLTGSAVRTGRCFRSLAGAGAAPLQQALDRPVPVGDPAWTAQWVIAQLGRCVLRIEDLQWADPLTRAAVELIAAQMPLAVTVRTGDPGSAEAIAALYGLVRIDLEPLDDEHAARFAAQVYPRLRADEAAGLARRCGGNPLLISELGMDAEPASSLRASLVRRLRRMGAEPWTGFGLLARAGEPVPATWVPALTELRAAGLVCDAHRDGGRGDGGRGGGDLVLPRHPLLSETVFDHLAEDPDDCRRIDLLLARRAEADGWPELAASAYAASGERRVALELARTAAASARRPGDRASLLGLAANCADGELAAELASDAVSELVQAGDYTAAAQLIDRMPHQRTASWLSLVGRVRWQTGDDDGALDAFVDAQSLACEGSRESILLHCESARAIVLSGGDPGVALALGEAAFALSVSTGRERARALAVLGTVKYFAGGDNAIGHLAEAVRLADDDPDADLQVTFSATNNLVGMLESAGRTDEAIAQADLAADRAESLRLRGWAQQMRAMGLNVRMHRGDYETVLAAAPGLLDQAIDRRTRDQLEVTLCLVLIDLGRADAAERRLTRALARCVDDHHGRGNLLWVASEARLWAGEPARALELATEALGLLPEQVRLFPLVTIAHAELRLGGEITQHAYAEPNLRVVEAVPVELAALTARSRGDLSAARLFDEAAQLWLGRHRRGELRCRWLAAEATADDTEARERLTALEHELDTDGWTPLLGQVRRAMRSRGVRRSAPRGRVGVLTLRERGGARPGGVTGCRLIWWPPGSGFHLRLWQLWCRPPVHDSAQRPAGRRSARAESRRNPLGAMPVHVRAGRVSRLREPAWLRSGAGWPSATTCAAPGRRPRRCCRARSRERAATCRDPAPAPSRQRCVPRGRCSQDRRAGRPPRPRRTRSERAPPAPRATVATVAPASDASRTVRVAHVTSPGEPVCASDQPAPASSASAARYPSSSSTTTIGRRPTGEARSASSGSVEWHSGMICALDESVRAGRTSEPPSGARPRDRRPRTTAIST